MLEGTFPFPSPPTTTIEDNQMRSSGVIRGTINVEHHLMGGGGVKLENL